MVEVAFNEEFRKKEYWDRRFEVEEEFEWFQPYNAFRHVTLNYMKPDDKILILGCGNSSLSRDLYDDGFKNIVNLDYSQIVIDKMQKKHQNCKEMSWVCMDMLNMDFEDNTFDLIIEKGTIDALLVGQKDQWKPSQEIINMMHRCLSEISRVLKSEGGRFLSITFSQPHFRKMFLCKPAYRWSVDVTTFGEFFHYFIYILKKGKDERITQEDDVPKVSFLKTEYFDNPDFPEIKEEEGFLNVVQDGLFAPNFEQN